MGKLSKMEDLCHFQKILKWSFLLKFLTTLNCKLILQKKVNFRCVTGSELPLTTINKTFFMNNKRAISQLFGNVTLNTQSGFYLFKVTIETGKILEQVVKCV